MFPGMGEGMDPAMGGGAAEAAFGGDGGGKGGAFSTVREPLDGSQDKTLTGERFTGVIKAQGPKFGFITSPEVLAVYGVDCFCLASQMSSFSIGDHVQFDIGINKDGKPQAMNLKGLGVGPTQGGNIPMPRATGETYCGIIKSISPKFGFIACPEITAMYGSDCFCLGRQLMAFNVGDTVEFQVGINELGKPQAIAVSSGGITQVWNDGKGAIVGTAAAGLAEGKGGGNKGKSGGGGCGFGGDWGKGDWGKGPPGDAGGGGGAWEPTWDTGCGGGGWDSGGWGGGGGGGWDSGAPRWLPSWVPLDDSGNPAGPAAGYGKGSGKGEGKDYSSPSGFKRRPEATGELFSGTVKSLSGKFGFIECEEVKSKYGADCFCLGDQLTGFSPGDPVSFEVGLSWNGKPQALSVTADQGLGSWGWAPPAKAARIH